jgi:hypothetical protein
MEIVTMKLGNRVSRRCVVALDKYYSVEAEEVATN